MNISDKLKFKLWGFSSNRVVLVLDALFFLYLVCVFSPVVQRHYPGCSVTQELLDPTGGLLELALFFCLLPPYNHTKLYICWPLTALAMFTVILLMPL